MRLELPVRWNETDRELERLSELTDGKIKADNPKYTYGRLSIDSSEIGVYYDMDPDHIMINDKNGKVYCVAVPFNDFKKIFTEVTGQAILSIQAERQLPPQPTQPKKRRDRGDSDIDDILK